jgi:endonuclease-8
MFHPRVDRGHAQAGRGSALASGSARPQGRGVPEGPEIRRAADRIEAVVGGRRAERVFFAFRHLAPFADELRGRTVSAVETRGKAMLTWFDDALAVYSHNQLYGRWIVRKKPGLPKTRRQLRFAIHTEAGAALLFSASEIAVLDREGIRAHPFLAKLGPDPLRASTTARTLRTRLTSPPFRRRRLAGLLLDQSFAAGLGNYLRSEILFDAGVHPAARPIDLSDEAVAALARSIDRIVRRAYRTGGITTDAKRATALKRAGQPRRSYRHYVFARAGRPCRACGDAVARLELAGRRVFLCPTCQPTPPR